MEPEKNNVIDKTILNPVKPTATSTVERKSFKQKSKLKKMDKEESLGILSLSDLNLSSILEEQTQNRENTTQPNVSYNLEEQRSRAEISLQRANNKVDAIPSKYLKPTEPTHLHTFQMNTTAESTINESDLLRMPADSSTPRSSVQCVTGRQSFSESVVALCNKLSSNSFNMENFMPEFKKTMNASVLREVVPPSDSMMFKPAEEVASMLLADEMAWRQEYELPVNDDAFSEINSVGELSVGEFFQERSDTLSDIIEAKSPKKNKPIPLVDTSTFTDDKSEVNIEIPKCNKTLSLTSIQRCLESSCTPRRALNRLLNQGKNVEEFKEISLEIFEKSSVENISVPVSNNSSYTSDHSDNEAMNILLNKENVDTLNTIKMSAVRSESVRSGESSSRSSSRALTSLPEGKLPIESTACELIWGCVKIDKCITQDFAIRNKSSKRVGLQMSVSGHDFKIRKDNRSDTELLSSTKFILGPHETKTIFVSFIPSRIGASIDQLLFTPIDMSMQQIKKQSVRLFGYGGHDKIELHNLTKDTTGKYWMSLGKLGIQEEIHKSFSFTNKGVLPSFVHITFINKGLFQVTVQPNLFVLIPQESKEVEVSYMLTNESYKMLHKYLNSNTVAELGTLQIISGAEVNRGRLRRLCRKVLEAGSIVDPLSNSLKDKIKGESMPGDLIKFRESTNAFKKVLECFNRNEVIVTVERDLDQTLFAQYPDESGMYQTLSEDSAMSVLENTICLHLCRVEPTIIFLMPPRKVTDSIFLISETNKELLHFEIYCEPEGLEIKPRDGMLNPKQELAISIMYSKPLSPVSNYKIRIYVDNDVFEATVKIK